MEWRRMLIMLMHEDEAGLNCANIQAGIQDMFVRAQINPAGLSLGGSDRFTDPADFGMALTGIL